MSYGSKKIDLQDVVFYLDGVACDRRDSLPSGRKIGEIIALKDQLLTMPEEDFNATIKALKGMVGPQGSDSSSRSPQPGGAKMDEAKELFNQANNTPVPVVGAPDKVNPV